MDRRVKPGGDEEKMATRVCNPRALASSAGATRALSSYAGVTRTSSSSSACGGGGPLEER